MRFLIAPSWPFAASVAAMVAFSAIGCGNDNDEAASREADSNPSADGDIAITATIEDVYSIGGADGEAWESFVSVTDAVFDAAGNLVVLDNLSRRVVVVAQDGNTHREVSRAGEGPGELNFPTALRAMQDGRLAVYDHGHRSFLIFGSDGGFAEHFRVGQEDPAIYQPPPPTSLVGKKLRALPDGRLLAFGGTSAGPGRPIEVIDLGAGRDTLFVAWDMATPPEPETQAVPTSSTDMIVAHSMRRPHFAPPLLVDVLSDGRVAIVDSIGYQVKLLSTRGTAPSVIERSIRPRDVTPAIKQSVRNAKEKGLAENAGVATEGVMASGLPPETIEALLRQALESDLQELTFAAHVPVIAAMAVDSEDRIWVARTGDDGVADGPTDIFSSEGEYVGTLAAADLRIPTAFGPGGLMAYVEKDEFDAAVVRVIRLLRLAPDGAPGA